jgi:hypothetical protein
MKKLNILAKVLIGLGVISLFRSVRSPAFGGMDNSWEIIATAILILIIGVILLLVSKKF